MAYIRMESLITTSDIGLKSLQNAPRGRDWHTGI